MRKYIRTLSAIVGQFEQYTISAHVNKVERENRRAYRKQQRLEYKLLMLKRATLLSYIGIVCHQELAASLRFETKDRLIDFLIMNGHADDCASAYEVR